MTSLDHRPVADLMTTDLLTVTPDESALMAWELMCRANVHHLPVVDDTGRFVGTVEMRTLIDRWEPAGPGRSRRPVRTVLPSGPAPAVPPQADIGAAARVMLDEGADHVAVVDAEGRLCGLLTAHDLIAMLAGRYGSPTEHGERGVDGERGERGEPREHGEHGEHAGHGEARTREHGAATPSLYRIEPVLPAPRHPGGSPLPPD
ncbi:HPP family protein [Actinomadura gamaensis]|uniref:HPP family protein n=1 Tax=Actinomadura gamaensis TaxID=1763541 RepID=A0ABV9TSL1_9ACTN